MKHPYTDIEMRRHHYLAARDRHRPHPEKDAGVPSLPLETPPQANHTALESYRPYPLTPPVFGFYRFRELPTEVEMLI